MRIHAPLMMMSVALVMGCPIQAEDGADTQHQHSLFEGDLILGGAASLKTVDGIDTTPSDKSYLVEVDALHRCAPAPHETGQWVYGAGLFYEQQYSVLSGDPRPPQVDTRGIALIGGRSVPFSDRDNQFSYETLVYTRLGYAIGQNGYGHPIRGLDVELGTRAGVVWFPFSEPSHPTGLKLGVFLDLQFTTIRPHGFNAEARAFDFSPQASIGYVF